MRHFSRILVLATTGAVFLLLTLSLGCPSANAPASGDDQTGANSARDQTTDVASLGDEGAETVIDSSTPSLSSLPWGAGESTVRFRLPLASDTSKHYFVDHDPNPGSVRDWNCSTETYDGHAGTDFSGIDRGSAVYAVAEGTLVESADAYPDGYLGFKPANGNFVRLDHGTDAQGNRIRTVYLHLQRGSVTTKPVGSAIACGEQIGAVGSSGNSSGLHLHFEAQLVTADGKRHPFDPYGGTCSSATNWWVDQGNGSPSAQCDFSSLQGFAGCSFHDAYPRADAVTYPRCPGTGDCGDTRTRDPWGFYNGECTSYVAWHLNRDANTENGPNFFFTNKMHPEITSGGGRWGNAENWADRAVALGFVVDINPAPGSVAHWRTSDRGYMHVAYVESVNTDDNSANITEYNFGTAHMFGYRCRVKAPRYLHISPSAPAQRYTLTVTPPAHGSVTLDPPGGTYDADTPVTLAASAASGWHFDHWDWGGGVTTSANPATVVMNRNITVTAVFEQDAVTQYGWQPLGSGIDAGITEHSTAHWVQQLLLFQDILVAAGNFSTAGGVAATNIARWDGTQWHAMGDDFPGPVSNIGDSLLIWNGQLISAGDENSSHDSVFRWTGSDWQPLSGGLRFSSICPVVYDNQLIVFGYDDRSGRYAGYFKWNGSAWEEFCSNPTEYFTHDLVSFAGTLYSGNGTFPTVMRWNGGAWEPLVGGTEDAGVMCLHEYDGGLFAGGYFSHIGGVAANKLARWAGSGWAAIDGGTDFNTVHRLRTYKNQLVACAVLGHSGYGHVMVWNGAQWSDLTTAPNGVIYDVVEFQGSLVAGGTFTSADGVDCNRVAKWAPLP